jgi:hypothetical protein
LFREFWKMIFLKEFGNVDPGNNFAWKEVSLGIYSFSENF